MKGMDLQEILGPQKRKCAQCSWYQLKHLISSSNVMYSLNANDLSTLMEEEICLFFNVTKGALTFSNTPSYTV